MANCGRPSSIPDQVILDYWGGLTWIKANFGRAGVHTGAIPPSLAEWNDG
jgi:hypothetical protein